MEDEIFDPLGRFDEDGYPLEEEDSFVDEDFIEGIDE